MSLNERYLRWVPSELKKLFSDSYQKVTACSGGGDEKICFSSFQTKALIRVWVASDFIRDYCIRYPTDFFYLLGQLTEYSGGRYTSGLKQRLLTATSGAASFEGFAVRLRRARHAEMVAIAWLDITGHASTEETVSYLSVLADECVQASLDYLDSELRNRYGGGPVDCDGRAKTLVVMGLGKLGGRELNFSSDIDLILAYADDLKMSAGAKISVEEYFQKLSRQLVKILSEHTAEGFVFRVDLRLRPFGDSGRPVLSLSATEAYYASHGREWERYAWIKARPIAGDLMAGQALLKSLKPFVYRRYLDFNAIGNLRALKYQIDTEVRRKGRAEDIKLGPGGIREIEFIAQVFQLMRGGQARELVNNSLVPVLLELPRLSLLPQTSVDDLIAAYWFLRQLENRLQQMADQQVHTLPVTELAQVRLALSLGFESWQTCQQHLDKHRAHVMSVFQGIFKDSNCDKEGADEVGEPLIDWRDSDIQPWLKQQGYTEENDVLKVLKNFSGSGALKLLSEKGGGLLDRLVKQVLIEAADMAAPVLVLKRFFTVLEKVTGRSTYLTLLVEYPEVRLQLMRLCAASPWFSEQVAQQPVLLDQLLDPVSLYQPVLSINLLKDLMGEILHEEDIEQKMNSLRRFRHNQMLSIAASDVSGSLSLMQVSDHLTNLAETILQAAFEACWADMTSRHGKPMSMIGGESRAAKMVIIGYGKLGGFELGYGSDLDIIFLHNANAQSTMTDGERPIENAVFFARLAQRIVNFLSTRTAAGAAYEIDTRLRPSGQSGLLVSSLEGFEVYQNEQAWTWEHQAMVRARPVAGHSTMRTAFSNIRHEILCRQRNKVELMSQIAEMRSRMISELDRSTSDKFDIKQGQGGLTDIEFIVQYLVLRWAHEYPELTTWTDNIRQLTMLLELGLFPIEKGENLIDTYKAYRDCLHKQSLQEAAGLVPMTQFVTERELVIKIWPQIFSTHL